MFTRLQGRLTLIFIVLAVAPLLTVSFIISSRSAATLERTALAKFEQMAQRVAVQADAFIDARVDELQLSANLNDLRLPEERAELEILLFRSSVYQEIAIIGADGQEVDRFTRSVGENLDHSAITQPLVARALGSDAPVYSDVFFDDVIREPLMGVAFPVRDVQTGESIYVLTALFSFRPVWEIVRDSQIDAGIEAYLLASNNQVIAHRDTSKVFGELLVQLPGAAGRLESEGETLLFAQAPLQLGDRTLTAVVQQPVSRALALEQENQRIVTLLTIGALLLAAALVVLVVRQIVRPITRLASAAQRIRDGDLAARADVMGRDEIGLLGVSFNSMAGQLAGMVDSLEQQVAERTMALNGALREVEERAARQAELLEQVARQREDILALSVPIMPVDRGTLVLPLVGAFDGQRLTQVQEQALAAIQSSAARRLIVDVTGAPVIDTQVAQGLLGVVNAARLLGTEVYLVGIRPEVAQTIVGLGLDFQSVPVFATLESALAARQGRVERPRLARAV